MLLSALLSLIHLVNIVSAESNIIGGQLLEPRQQLCSPSSQPVKACGPTDLTTANWRAFNIDNFLSLFIQTFGTGSRSDIGFPGFFVRQNLVPGTPFLFDCSTIGSTLCRHPSTTNPAVGTDCAFRTIPNIGQQVCGKYVTPQAGFVVENFIRFHEGVSNSFLAMGDAKDAILNTNFIDDVVDGLSEEQGNILDTVFRAIANFVVGILPFGRAFQLGVRLFKSLDKIYSVAGFDRALSSEVDVIKTIVANEQIRDLAARTKDQLRRQVDEIIRSSQNQLQQSLDIVFGTGPESVSGQNGIDAQDRFAFGLAQSGAFLDAVPPRRDLAAVMETNLKNWIVSSTITGMQWDVLLDTNKLLDDPANPGRVCRDGFKGIPGVLGAECALFRRGGFAGIKPQNPAVIERLINVENAVRNALECGGGNPNWQAVVEGTDTSGTTLPRCLYSFAVTGGR